jgi:uncharacterized protein
MDGLVRILVLCVVLLGHFGWWVFAYNRINATGLPRSIVKFFERGVFLPTTLLLPLFLGWLYFPVLSDWLREGQALPSSAFLLKVYALFCLAVVGGIGPFWLYSRFYLLPPQQLLKSQLLSQIDLRSQRESLCQKKLTRQLAKLPGNCILEIHSGRKSLCVPNWPDCLNGFRIGHISDLHFTGQLSRDFYRHAFEELIRLRPDMIVITGDIIDKAKCLPWIEELLSDLRAPHGCYFVLGNHDKRIFDSEVVRQAMARSGWVDLGSQVIEADIHGQRIMLAGHERPWFGQEPQFGANSTGAFRLALAHSPDAIDWAQQQQVDLLLAGHTHGGQIRFPIIGPIVAPSWYGSQFASGVFYRQPTLMHVSRGLAGVHPLRYRCQPEIALLELYSTNNTE